MVSFGFIHGFFRVHSGFHVGFPWVSPKIQTNQNKAQENEKERDSIDRKQRSRK